MKLEELFRKWMSRITWSGVTLFGVVLAFYGGYAMYFFHIALPRTQYGYSSFSSRAMTIGPIMLTDWKIDLALGTVGLLGLFLTALGLHQLVRRGES